MGFCQPFVHNWVTTHNISHLWETKSCNHQLLSIQHLSWIQWRDSGYEIAPLKAGCWANARDNFGSYPMTDPWCCYILYMVLHGSHEYTPFMLAYIPAPWIRHGYVNEMLRNRWRWRESAFVAVTCHEDWPAEGVVWPRSFLSTFHRDKAIKGWCSKLLPPSSWLSAASPFFHIFPKNSHDFRAPWDLWDPLGPQIQAAAGRGRAQVELHVPHPPGESKCSWAKRWRLTDPPLKEKPRQVIYRLVIC